MILRPGPALLALVLAPALTTAAPAAAVSQERLGVSLSFGTLDFQDLQRQPVLAQRLDESGDPAGEPARLSRTLGVETGWHASGSAVIGLTPSWALRLGGGVGGATLTARYSGEDSDKVAEVRSLAIATSAAARITMWDAALRFWIPTPRRLRPYAELGVGVVGISADEGEVPLPGTHEVADGRHRGGAYAGVGMDVPVRSWLAVRLQASTRVFSTHLSPIAEGSAVARGDSLMVSFAAPDAAAFADAALETSRLLRLEAGFTIRMGAAADPARPESAPRGSTSGSRR